LPFWQLRILRKFAKTLIYDFDDAVFHRDSYHPKGIQSWQRLAHFWATIYAADTVMAGNGYLRDRAASYVPAEKVHLFPTCVEPHRYPTAAHRRGGSETKLVWIGQRSTLPSLYQAEGQLTAAAAAIGGLELRVVSDAFPTLSGIAVACRRWSVATEAGELADADVGVSWLPEDGWSLGKCGLKVLQFMAAGLPVVANPVGIHRQMVVHGETGFLASTADEWAQAIRQLATDPALRARFGAAGRRVVERQYSVQSRSAELIEVLNRSVSPAARQSAGPRSRAAVEAAR
jgi:hypothetical protein